MALSSSSTMNHRHYIFGYGSLICHRSRSITAPSLSSKHSIPVIIDHYTRTWTARIHHHDNKVIAKRSGLDHGALLGSIIQGQTAMGIERAENKKCSGVLIEVDDAELRYFDEREMRYDRVEIDLLHIWGLECHKDEEKQKQQQEEKEEVVDGEENVSSYDNHIDMILQMATIKRCRRTQQLNTTDDDPVAMDEHVLRTLNKIKVWVYIPQTPMPANKNYPIVQSYVDVIMRGCLDYGHEFASHFIQTTEGWLPCQQYKQLDCTRKVNTVGSYMQQKKGITPHHSKHKQHQNQANHFVWVEDRDNPFYIRADLDYSKEKAKMLDELLNQQIPSAFVKRKKLDRILGADEKIEEEFD